MRTVHKDIEVKEEKLGIIQSKEENESSFKSLAPCLPSVKPEQVYDQCKECGKNLNSKSLQKHMRDVHKEVKIKEEIESMTKVNNTT